MRVFDLDPAEYAQEYARRGWVHIRGGVSPELHDSLSAYVRESLASHMLDGRAAARSTCASSTARRQRADRASIAASTSPWLRGR